VQAERYSKGFRNGRFDFNGHRLPFVYSTNGQVIWFRDLRRKNSRSRKISRFHTPDALEEMLTKDVSAYESWLERNPVSVEGLRPYQKEAIEATEDSLSLGKQKMLLAMATGTGKTFVAAAQMYRLLKSGFSKRILFLVDRRALAAQAVGALASFTPEPGLKFDNTARDSGGKTWKKA
jgi:type I restriction enzyme R subunit